MSYNCGRFSEERFACNFSDIYVGDIKLAPFCGDEENDWIGVKDYLDKVFAVTRSYLHPYYQLASSTFHKIIKEGIGGPVFIDSKSIQYKLLDKNDEYLREQLFGILTMAYKERYGCDDYEIPEFRQVSDSPHECTAVATCTGYDGKPVILCTIRHDFNPDMSELEIFQFFNFGHSLKERSTEFCRFAYHPIFNIWAKSDNSQVRLRANIIQGILIRYMFLMSFMEYAGEGKRSILCTMARNIALFIKRVSGFTVTQIEDATVNTNSDYYKSEQEKYPKYFVPERLHAYKLEFDVNKAKMILPKDMIQE